ncbi:MAG: hypothetical protein HZC36_01005, partial [Armatimonadetes bacterium]|nr:hypothetical protein [Armatimonadota bacterium]
MTRQDRAKLTAPSPDSPLLAAWQFDATTADASSAPVHVFPASLMISMHFSADDLVGRNPATLAFWTFDESLRQWLRVPGSTDAASRTLTVAINHFSVDSATADELINMAPLLDGHNVGLHARTANLKVPIVVPPGRGGLTPQLALSYDSGRTDEMRQYSSNASWVGTGWELSTGSLTVQPGANGNLRAFLSAGDFGGEMMPDGTTDGGRTVWRLRDEVYVRIRTDCYGNPFAQGHVISLCTWWVTDKSGRVYTFGGDMAYARYTMVQYSTMQGVLWERGFYQFDLATVTDPLGNQIGYTYTPYTATDPTCAAAPQQQRPLGCTYLLSAYPASVSYNYNTSNPPVAQTVIQFNTGCDGTPGVDYGIAGTGPSVCMRNDTPRNFAAGGNCSAYTAPLVLETQRLNSIDVRQSGALVRHYDLTHATTPFYRTRSDGGTLYIPPCSPYVGYMACVYDQYHYCYFEPSATDQGQGYYGGTDLLTGFTIKGADGTSSLASMTFEYAPKHVNYSTGGWDYNWQHLKQAGNGLGGHVLFSYSELTAGTGWSREAVTQETHQAGFGEPDIVTDYTYSNGPAYQQYPDPYNQPYYSGGGPGYSAGYGYDPFNGIYRGFGQVTETDSANNPTVHYYYTTGKYCCGATYPFPTSPADWINEILTGREYLTVVKDSSGTNSKTFATTFNTVAIPNSFYSTPPQSQGQSFINFVSPLQVATTLKDGSQSYTQTGFDGFGNLTQQNDFVGTPPVNPTSMSACAGAPCILSTTTGWLADTTDWIFRPTYSAMTDPQTANAVLACSRNYYDGATTADAPLSSGKGLLTATSTAITLAFGAQCNASATPFASSTNRYTEYYGFGSPYETSEPTTVYPESQVNLSWGGWVPTGVPYTRTTRDFTYGYVMQAAAPTVNGIAPTTNYNVGGSSFDFRLGKPTQVSQANGNVLNYRYDTFGRLE